MKDREALLIAAAALERRVTEMTFRENPDPRCERFEEALVIVRKLAEKDAGKL